MDKKLYRSTTDIMISGVCGGIGEYFHIDPNIVRIITVVLCCGGGLGLVAYLAAALLLPKNPY